jgi:hypothetical protein
MEPARPARTEIGEEAIALLRLQGVDRILKNADRATPIFLLSLQPFAAVRNAGRDGPAGRLFPDPGRLGD